MEAHFQWKSNLNCYVSTDNYVYVDVSSMGSHSSTQFSLGRVSQIVFLWVAVTRSIPCFFYNRV